MLTMQRLSVYITNEYRIDLKDEKTPDVLCCIVHSVWSMVLLETDFIFSRSDGPIFVGRWNFKQNEEEN